MYRWDTKKRLLHFSVKGSLCVAGYWPPWAARLDGTGAGPSVWRHFRPAIDLKDADFAEPDPRRAAVPLSRIAVRTPERLREVLAAGGRIPLAGWLDRRARRAAARTVPRKIRKLIVEKYGVPDSRKGGRQWSMLSFCARVPLGDSLVRSSPALAMMLANSWVFRKEKAVARPLRSARSLVRAPQARILQWLRWSVAAKNILKRVDMRETEIINLLYLRDACRSPNVIRKLSHLPSINASVIRAMDPALEPHVGHHFLLALASQDESDPDLVVW